MDVMEGDGNEWDVQTSLLVHKGAAHPLKLMHEENKNRADVKEFKAFLLKG